MEFTPEHVHVMINHFPLVGLVVGMGLLLVAGILKQRPVIGAALWVIALCAGMTFLVAMTGDKAADRMFDSLDKGSQKWMGEHAERAEKMEKACYLLAVLAVAGYFIRRLQPKSETWIVWIFVILTGATLVGNWWVADAGGKIRHPEFREHVSGRK